MCDNLANVNTHDIAGRHMRCQKNRTVNWRQIHRTVPTCTCKRGKKDTIDTKMEQMHFFSVRMYSFNVHGSMTIIADTLALR